MVTQERGIPTFFIIPLIQFFVGILLFIALLFHQKELAIQSFLLLGVGAIVKLWSIASLSNLSMELKVDRNKLFPGDSITISVEAANKKLLPIWLYVRVPIIPPIDGSAQGSALTKQGSLLWFQRAQFRWTLIAGRRGVYQVGRPQFFAGDLFDFFPRRKASDDCHGVVVYPRLIPLKPLALPQRDFFGVPGARSPVQDPVFILGTRDYQNGRPAKYIHWKASARHDLLQEKELESSQHEKVLLAVDVAGFVGGGSEEAFEQTLEVVASMAARMDRQGLSVGFVANGVAAGRGPAVVPVARSHQQLSLLLEILARLERKADRPILEMVRRVVGSTWGVSCVYFSRRHDETVSAVKAHLARLGAPVLFVVCQSAGAFEDNRVRRLEDIRAERGVQ